MTPEEQQLLTALADRIKGAPAQQHDADADALLGQLLRQRPDTPYLLAQTVLMQELAMRNAQAQIGELQRQVAATQQAPAQPSSGGFLSGLFGGGSVPPVNPWASQGYAAQQPQAYAPVVMQPSQTSGFLRSAATTAAGIAGGALLFEGIESLFSGHQGYGGFMNPSGWGGWGGGGGDFGPRESLSETTINNYYDGQPGGGQQAGGQQQSDFNSESAFDQSGGYQDASDTGTGDFDGGGDFGGDSGGDFST